MSTSYTDRIRMDRDADEFSVEFRLPGGYEGALKQFEAELSRIVSEEVKAATANLSADFDQLTTRAADLAMEVRALEADADQRTPPATVATPDYAEQSHPLATELATYRAKLPTFLATGCEGRWVVICGRQVQTFEFTYEDALKVGYRIYGASTPFLVKKIAAEGEKPTSPVTEAKVPASRHFTFTHADSGRVVTFDVPENGWIDGIER